MSVRTYIVESLNGVTAGGGSSIAGGDVLLETGQHALDGPEHTATSDVTTLDASASAHGLLPKLSGDPTDFLQGDGAWGPALTVMDEGTPLATAATSFDFVGAGVTASGTGPAKTITIPGGGGATIPGPTIGAAVDIYVDVATGDDTTGDGSVGLPYATIMRGLEDVPTIVGAQYTVHVADGTYREEVDVNRFSFLTFGGESPPAKIILTGNTTTPANCVISGADSGAPTTPVRTFCILAYSAFVTIEGFKLQYATTRGIQAYYHSLVTLGNMAYDNCGDGMLLGAYSLVYLTGDQTFSNVARGIYLTEFSRVNTSGGRTITMTGITERGLYIVESTMLLNAGDVLSITAAGSGTRMAGIETDGIGTTDLPVSVTVSGAFNYSVVAVGGSEIHLASATVTTSGFVTAAYFANDMSAIWDMTTSSYLAGGTGTVSFATPAIVLAVAAADGAATTAIRSDATIVAFDATAPTTQAFGDAAATGSAAVAARRDHLHGMPATPSTSGSVDHAHVVEEVHLSDGASTTYTLDEAFLPGSVIAWNTTTLARLLVTEAAPDQATVSAAGASGDKIMFDYAALVA